MSENLIDHEQRVENNNTFSNLAELPAFDLEQAQENVDRVKEQLNQDKRETTAYKVGQLRGYIDLEAIAKDQDPDGLALAQEESERRENLVNTSRTSLSQITSQYEAKMAQIDQQIATKQLELNAHERRNKNGIFGKLKTTLGIGEHRKNKLNEEIEELTIQSQEARRDLGKRDELERVIAETDTNAPTQEFIEQFETPLSPEEKKENLDFEALKELSTEEYLRLWRRLNPFYITHVTRQGLRDHNAMVYHSAGMGEFHGGLTSVLADGKKLRTPAEVHYGIGREITEESVARSLDKMLPQDTIDIDGRRADGKNDQEILDEIIDGLPVNHTIAAADSWADPQAVHFGQLTALDDYYGAESGNEALFVFPTDVIASQCRFGGHNRGNFMTAEVDRERKWNDLFVWPREQDISIDAGLTFLPKSTMVDPNTGSKYATEIIKKDGQEVRIAKVDIEAIEKFTSWIKTLKTEDEAVKTYLEKYESDLLKHHALEAGVSERIMDEILNGSEHFEYRLKQFLEGEDLSDTMWLIPQEELSAMTPEERHERSITDFLNGKTSTWKLAESPVPAEEYWEGYFRDHKDQRPAHIIYYDGDPSAAIEKTLQDAGILETIPKYNQTEGIWITGKGDSHERDGNWLGFDENYVSDESTDEQFQGDHRRFNELARGIIAKRYNLQV